jgi:DNA-binding HxlR family transcriptional regulator
MECACSLRLIFRDLTVWRIAISQKMLTQTLRELEQNGVVERKVFPVVPPHTEYSMTELGQGLNEILGQINAWARYNLEAVLEARSQFAMQQGLDR